MVPGIRSGDNMFEQPPTQPPQRGDERGQRHREQLDL